MRHWRLILALAAFALVFGAMALTPVKPGTCHATWAWSATNRVALFLNSNGVTVRYVETTNQSWTFSNLVTMPGVYSAELYSIGNGQSVTWGFTNYLRTLFSTNATGPWSELVYTTWPYPPASGFLRFTNFNNFPTKPD